MPPLNTQPLVSIIVPVFNAQEFLEEAIDSVLNQTYKNFQVIVVDDGSTDRSINIIKGYGSRITYIQQVNSGPAVSRNKGISLSNGKYLCFLDADDIMLPDRVARHVEFMERHPDIGLTFCDYRNFTADGPYHQSHFQSCTKLLEKFNHRNEVIIDNACMLLSQENIGLSGSVFLRREILGSKFMFNEDIIVCEDFVFYFTLARYFKVGVINQIGIKRRFHDSNLTKNRYLLTIDGIRSRTMLLNNETNSDVRRELNRYIINKKLYLAGLYADRGQLKNSLNFSFQVMLSSLCGKESLFSFRHMLRAFLLYFGFVSIRSKLEEPVKSQNPDGFEKSAKLRRTNLEE